jgi:hypothetical protein
LHGLTAPLVKQEFDGGSDPHLADVADAKRHAARAALGGKPADDE